jgi:uncharacterized phage protein gp47/JayE
MASLSTQDFVVVLWLQGLAVYILTLTRAATSSGADLDSWMADYGLIRLPATAATGQVTFSRFTDTTQAVIPFGALIATGDGTQNFSVDTDSTNGAYNATLGGYVLGIGTPSVTVKVTDVNSGSGGNVLANSITSIGQAISGIDTVTNASAFTNGIDAESDASFRARFVLFIASLSKGTEVAIRAAIANVQQALQCTITENDDYDSTYDPGFFFVVIDDGTGDPSSDLLASVGNAIEAVRALGIRFAVFAPVVVTADVSMEITSAAGFDHPTVVGNVGLAVTTFLTTLPLGAGLPYTRLASVAYAVAGVTNVSAILLNSGTADIAADVKKTIKAGTVSIS